ncbi:multidrug resistance-associated protein 5 [Tanacetum coccineum]
MDYYSTSGGVHHNGSKTEYESDDDSDYQSYKSADYLSPGEDELIKLTNRMKANRKAKAKAKDKPNSKMNEPNEENSMPTDNVRGKTFGEHDIYMNELLKSLKTADKDGITEDPFISVEKHVERYPMYDETTHWRLRKPKVGEKYTSVAQFKECLTYYALANGFSLWANPEIRLCDIANLVMKKYKCKVSLNQCTNAEKYALTEYEKSIGEHYSMLRSYEKAISDSNPGSTVKLGVTVNPDGKTYFDRFYVCFAGLADGWKAVVNVENKDNWTWFLKLLEEDLGCSRGNGLTLMSDQHKVLLKLLKMQLFWAASKASYPQLFNNIMDKIESATPNAHKYLMYKNPKTWSRAFFEVDRGCEAIENGFSECFNSVIVNVRHKPLLTMLEAIRVIVLERMNKMREISRKWNPRFWHVIPAGGDLYEVRSRSEGFTVDEGKRTCSCRMWQLSGLPCVATKVTFLINRVLESYVPAWFEIDMYFVAYHNYVQPVPGMNFWPDQSMYSTVLPPKPRKMLGKPRKKSIRAIGKGDSSTRVSKVDSQGSCSNCKKPGHNKSSCKEPVVEQTPKPKGVVGASGTRGGAIGSRGRGGDGSRGGASGSIGKGAGGSSGASESRGRGAVGSRGGASGSIGRGASGSKRKLVSTDGT